MWKTEISDNKQEDSQSKKDIFNIITGLLGKTKNKMSVTRIFKDYDEAFYYQTIFGGEIYNIGDDSDNINHDVFGGKELLYLLQKKTSVELISGFLPIKEMIYDIRSLSTLVKKLEEGGYKDMMELTNNERIIDNLEVNDLILVNFDCAESWASMLNVNGTMSSINVEVLE